MVSMHSWEGFFPFAAFAALTALVEAHLSETSRDNRPEFQSTRQSVSLPLSISPLPRKCERQVLSTSEQNKVDAESGEEISVND